MDKQGHIGKRRRQQLGNNFCLDSMVSMDFCDQCELLSLDLVPVAPIVVMELHLSPFFWVHSSDILNIHEAAYL